MSDDLKVLVEAQTLECGGEWGMNHSRRLLSLIETIGECMDYDKDAVWLAAHLHDWGGYKRYAIDGVDHAVRSHEVAGGFLDACSIDSALRERVLSCILHHHSPSTDLPVEALLLCDADALDFLGVTGVLRDYSKKPLDLRGAHKTAKARMAKLPGQLVFPRSLEISKQRLEDMTNLLAAFERETAGVF